MIQPMVWMVWLSSVAASHLENSLKPRSIITSLFSGRQAVGQLLTVWQRDFLQEPAGTAVAKRCIAEHRVIAGLQRALGPARACQHPRARDLEHPGTGGLAALGVFLDDEADVGVGPIDGLDRAFHGLGMIEIVGGIRMVRRCDAAKAQNQARSKKNDFRRHFLIILFHGVDRAVLALRVCNEDVVAELILSRNQIFLFALALGDLIMTLRVARSEEHTSELQS